MATGFKKTPITAKQIKSVQEVTATVPLNGPNAQNAAFTSAASLGGELSANLGSSQESQLRSTSLVYAVGGVYNIPVNRVHSNPMGPREVYTEAAVDAMGQRLLSQGQILSATGYVDVDGEVYLIEGETRLRGARAVGLPTLRIEIKDKPASDQALYEQARSANVHRNEQSPLDDAIKWRKLLDKKIYPSQVALSKALGLTEDLVSRTLSLSSMPTKILYICADNAELCTLKMLNAIREFWEVKGDEETVELIFEIAKTGMGYRDVSKRRKSAAQGVVKRPRADTEKISYFGAQGSLKTFEDGKRIELLLDGLPPEASEKLIEQILSLLKN